MVERRAQVFITALSPAFFPAIFLSSFSSTYGPLYSDLDIFVYKQVCSGELLRRYGFVLRHGTLVPFLEKNLNFSNLIHYSQFYLELLELVDNPRAADSLHTETSRTVAAD